MNKLLFLICFLALGSLCSCGNDDNMPENEYHSGGYRDGKYEGEYFYFIVDGDSVDGAVAEVQTKDDMMTFTLSNSSLQEDKVVFTAKYFETDVEMGYFPDNFVGKDGHVYKYDYSFDTKGVLTINCYSVVD